MVRQGERASDSLLLIEGAARKTHGEKLPFPSSTLYHEGFTSSMEEPFSPLHQGRSEAALGHEEEPSEPIRELGVREELQGPARYDDGLIEAPGALCPPSEGTVWPLTCLAQTEVGPPYGLVACLRLPKAVYLRSMRSSCRRDHFMQWASETILHAKKERQPHTVVVDSILAPLPHAPKPRLPLQ